MDAKLWIHRNDEKKKREKKGRLELKKIHIIDKGDEDSHTKKHIFQCKTVNGSKKKKQTDCFDFFDKDILTGEALEKAGRRDVR